MSDFYYYVKNKALKNISKKQKLYFWNDFTLLGKIFLIFILLGIPIAIIMFFFQKKTTNFTQFIIVMVYLFIILIFSAIGALNEALIYKKDSLLRAEKNQIDSIVNEIEEIFGILNNVCFRYSLIFPKDNFFSIIDRLALEATEKVENEKKKYNTIRNVLITAILIPLVFSFSTVFTKKDSFSASFYLSFLIVASFIYLLNWFYFCAPFFLLMGLMKNFY